ncbi:MAG: hypothetical protein EA378_09150 [Phycisphaerales bacterium]|nr:MAG: hypothetical protein EA378_09150 [Phycisphaerales bacterium]
MSEAWSTNVSIAEIGDWLRGKPRVAVLTHGKPDGDAIGSTAAVVRAINHASHAPGHAARAWYVGPVPGWVKSIANGTAYRVVEDNGLPQKHEAEAVLICDTGSRAQLEGYADLLKTEGFAQRAAIVDHHLQGDAELAERRHVDSSAAAACEPVAELCAHIMGLAGVRELPKDVATPLYLGLATDTGWFKHSNVRPRTLRLAADLLEAGADHAWLYRVVEQRDRVSRLRLLGRAFEKMTLHCDGRVAVLPLSIADYHAARAGPGETGGFADQVLNVAGVLVAVVLTEVEAKGDPAQGGEPARVKLSFRSKSGRPAVDVNAVAQTFGGGGHAQAAGARLEGAMDEVIARVVAALTPAVEEAGAGEDLNENGVES